MGGAAIAGAAAGAAAVIAARRNQERGSNCCITKSHEHDDKNQIRNMQIGEIGYAVPWAACQVRIAPWFPRSSYKYILNGSYSVDTEPHGTAIMKVERTKLGYRIYVSETTDQVPKQDRHSWGSEEYDIIRYGVEAV